MKKSRWIYYTVGVAALPIIIRIIVFFLMSHQDLSNLFNAIDFVYFGLTLNLSNMNELNSLRIKKRNDFISEKEKEKLSSWSIYAIIALCLILGLQYVPNEGQHIFNPWTMLVASVLLAVVSFFLSLKVINKINAVEL